MINDPDSPEITNAWNLGLLLGACLQYINLAEKKDPEKQLEDLIIAKWYLDRAIENLRKPVPLTPPFPHK